MKEKRREVEGKIFSHNEGLGTVTRQMIEDRAQEIAVIDGRSRPTKYDRVAARKELLRMHGIRDEMEDVDLDHDSLDPSETRAIHGRQTQNFEPDDEEQVQMELVEEGLEEADHEHMLEGHYAQDEAEEGEMIEERDESEARSRSARKEGGEES